MKKMRGKERVREVKNVKQEVRKISTDDVSKARSWS